MDIEDSIWKIFDNCNSIKEDKYIKNYCRECNKNIIDSTCEDCGLVVSNEIEFSNYVFDEESVKKPLKVNSYSNSRIIKMQEWSRWSNEEKKEYKLNQYINELCLKLKVHQMIIGSVCSLVYQVMIAIKDSSDGPKRAKVKDGIIIMCIYYTLKNSDVDNEYISYIELSKRINLDIKYVSKADKLIMDLINIGQLKLPEKFIENIVKPEKPMEHIFRVIKKYNLDINDKIINQVCTLINICEDNDILVDHTPLSIGVGCFYYILDYNNIDINAKVISELYKISIVTILKIFNKLKVYDSKLHNLIK